MAKSQRGPSKKSLPKKDEYERISFLYQVANIFCQKKQFEVIARGYSRNADLISKKAVIKLTPNLKRSICKKCNIILVPGLSLNVCLENASKAKAPENDILVYTCSSCGTIKRFPVGKNRHYQLFSEQHVIL